MIRREVVSGAIIIAISIALFAYTSTFLANTDSEYDLGTRFFPRAILLLIMGLGALLVLQGIFPKRFNPSSALFQEGKSKEDEEIGATLAFNSGITILLTAVYLVSFSIGGYFIGTPIYIAAVLWLAGIRRVRTVAAVSFGFLLFTYIVFFKLLNVPFLFV